jgi:conjugative transposon TraN protein
MKIIVLFSAIIMMMQVAQAQNIDIIYVNENVSTHFVTSEPVTYVDLSMNHVIGDLAAENILRIKPDYTGIEKTGEQGILTIVCQKYMVQYQLRYAPAETATKSKFISAKDGIGLLKPEIGLSAEEMKIFSKQILLQSGTKPLVKAKGYKMKVELLGVYAIGDYYFLDVALRNNSYIPFDIDLIQFKLEDKQIIKAVNNQDIILEPEFVLNNRQQITQGYRNVFVFKSFTFPNAKILTMEVAEKQLSGRTITLEIDYNKILKAEPLLPR